MADATRKPILSRMAASARARRAARSVRAVREPTESADVAVKGLTRALKRAGMAFAALVPEPFNEQVVWCRTRDQVTEMLPEGGLLALLETEGRARGLVHMHQGFVDALIEVQTTGTIDRNEGAARAATPIDAALCQDYIQRAITALANEFEIAGLRDLAPELKYGDILPDRRQLPLLVPDTVFHALSASVDLGEGARLSSILLVLPGEPASADVLGGREGPDPVWQKAWHRSIGGARLPFEAVLLRTRRRIGQIEAMAPGVEIGFTTAELGAVRLEDSRGLAVFRARLGQSGGQRAVRLLHGVSDALPDAGIERGAGAAPAPVPKRDEPGGLPAPGGLTVPFGAETGGGPEASAPTPENLPAEPSASGDAPIPGPGDPTPGEADAPDLPDGGFPAAPLPDLPQDAETAGDFPEGGFPAAPIPDLPGIGR